MDNQTTKVGLHRINVNHRTVIKNKYTATDTSLGQTTKVAIVNGEVDASVFE